MALTVAPVREFVIGDRLELIADVTFDASYATGGVALTPATLGFNAIDSIGASGATGGNTFAYDYTNQKLKAFSGGSEVANATDLSAVKTRVTARGKGFPIVGPF